MDAIVPLIGTYFALLPVELRRLLYLYFNTSNMTFSINNNFKDIVVSINFKSDKNIRLLLYFDKFFVKSQRLQSFINRSLEVMNLLRTTSFTYDIFVSRQLVLELFYSNFSIDVTNYSSNPLESNADYLSITIIPLSIQLLDCLQQVYKLLTK